VDISLKDDITVFLLGVSFMEMSVPSSSTLPPQTQRGLSKNTAWLCGGVGGGSEDLRVEETVFQ
jgi:hypothetical protein